MTPNRRLTWLDKICIGFDQTLKTLTNEAKATGQAYPAAGLDEGVFAGDEQKQVAGFMRVNHTGEVCAQALYHGQAAVSRHPPLKAQLAEAALEEGDHLQWCKARLDELGSRTSYLNPLWYMGSFCMGAAAGLMGDDWSLGFLEETERQVIQHLEGHLERLPPTDVRSRAILNQMKADEAKHRDAAIATGAKILPPPVKVAMRWVSRVMVKTAYTI